MYEKISGIKYFKNKLIVWIYFTIILVSVTEIQAETEAELYERIFGNANSLKTSSLEIPLIVDNNKLCDILAIISDDPLNIELDESTFFDKAGPLIDYVVLEKIKEQIDETNPLNLKMIQNAGLGTDFDKNLVILHITIPPELRRQDVTSLRNGMPLIRGELVKPSIFSAYINVYAEEAYVYQTDATGTLGRQPFKLKSDYALNLSGLVFESGGSYLEGADFPWQLGATRLVFDDIDNEIRYAIGQISYPVLSYQRAVPLAGITMAKNYSLQPYRYTRPQGATEFFLDNPSRVEVWVNNRLTKTLNLPAGSHHLEDFSFYSGVNNLILRITDNFGMEEELNFAFFYDSELLKPGEWQFAYTMGLPVSMEEGLPTTELKFPTISLFNKFPINNNVTVGMNVQGNEDQQLFGIECLWAGPIGIIKGELAGSRLQSRGLIDIAARLKYKYFNAGSDNPSNRLWTFLAEYMSPSFATLGNLNPLNNYPLTLSMGYSQSLPWGIDVNLGAGYNLGLGSIPDNVKLNIGLRLSVKGGHSFQLRTDFGWKITDVSSADYSLFLGYTYQPPRSRYSVRTDYAAPSNKASVTLQYRPKNDIGGVGWDVNIDENDSIFNISGNLSYKTSFMETNFTHEIGELSFNGDTSIQQESRLTLGSALVFVDGRFGISRPVRDNFIIIAPHKNLRKHTIGVNPSYDKYSAQTNFLSPAVLPNLSSYHANTITVDVPDIPLGYEMGPEEYTFIPGYKSAALIIVGTDANILLGGTILDPYGTPVSMQAGKIVSLNDSDWEARTLFTNTFGKFRVEGIRPGEYEIRLFTDDTMAIEVSIPEGKEGFYDLGVLSLSAVE